MFETDPAALARRQKQIDYGKNTAEYANYLETVPKESRTSAQPHTPDRWKKASRRAWDGEIRMWRLLLHAYDPKCGQESKPNGENENAVDRKSVSTSTPILQAYPSFSGNQQVEQQQPYSFRGYNFARVSLSNKQL